MKILIDNELNEYRRLITIQENSVEIHDVLEMIIDGLQACGYPTYCIEDAIIEKAVEIEQNFNK